LIYVDSCTVIKLIIEEEHSAALVTYLSSATLEMISSELTRVEVCRTLIRIGQRERTRAETDALLSQIAKLPVVAGIIDKAGDAPGPTLRTLDALHLATATRLGPAVTEFITYDKRLAKAATEAGLPLTMPGVN
jgi:predicted nucleic acid-binding protein